MRTIKFRGKSSRHDKDMWLYGDLININDSYHIVEKNDMREDGHHITQDSDRPTWVNEKTIGQFTCLLDKNGKEIYEGDIVRTKSGWGGVVLWNSRGYFYIKDNNYLDNEEPDLSPLGSLHCCERHDIEVVGNIYDNHELWKGDNNE